MARSEAPRKEKAPDGLCRSGAFVCRCHKANTENKVFGFKNGCSVLVLIDGLNETLECSGGVEEMLRINQVHSVGLRMRDRLREHVF